MLAHCFCRCTLFFSCYNESGEEWLKHYFILGLQMCLSCLLGYLIWVAPQRLFHQFSRRLLLPENSYSSLRLQLWLPHIFHWHLILLTATLVFELTLIRIMFILAYPLMKVCLPLYTKVVYEVSFGFLFFFLILYSSLFLHKLINLCFSITSVFMCPSSLQ